MVGRELLTICPKGEDHQGHDWGGTKRGGGYSWGSRGGWRSWILMMMMMMRRRMMMIRGCFWILFLKCNGLEGRNHD